MIEAPPQPAPEPPDDSVPQPPVSPQTPALQRFRAEYQSHIDWLPGEPHHPLPLLRSGTQYDVQTVNRIFTRWGYRIDPLTILGAVATNGYSFRVISRNSVPVAGLLGHHSPRLNRVLAFGCAWEYAKRRSFTNLVIPKFIRVLQEELPELPTQFTLPSHRATEYLSPILTRLGFHWTHSDGKVNKWHARPLYIAPEYGSRVQADQPGTQAQEHPVISVTAGDG